MPRRDSGWLRPRPIASGNPNFRHDGAVAPPKIPPGKVRCPACRNVASLTPTGKLYRHKDLFAEDCWNRTLAADPDATALATSLPVVPTREGNRLPPTGKCHDCGRPVSGERRYCGRCLASH